jgi:hypothetical protein
MVGYGGVLFSIKPQLQGPEGRSPEQSRIPSITNIYPALLSAAGVSDFRSRSFWKAGC